MITTKDMHGDSIYVIEGLCTANTHFIEKIDEAKMFLNLVNTRLRDYMHIMEYIIKPTGWYLLVKTKSDYVIKTQYEKKLELKDSAPVRSLTTVTHIISEAIRLLRSRFTNITNPLRGRQGNASKRVYKKYYFNSAGEARAFVERVREGEILIEQPNTRYQANPAHYDEDGQLKKNSEILTSKRCQEQQKKTSVWMTCIKIYDLFSVEFTEMIERTLERHRIR